jgi:hypothetical protein
MTEDTKLRNGKILAFIIGSPLIIIAIPWFVWAKYMDVTAENLKPKFNLKAYGLGIKAAIKESYEFPIRLWHSTKKDPK